FFFQAEDGIRDWSVTGVQTCALPISSARVASHRTARAAVARRGRLDVRHGRPLPSRPRLHRTSTGTSRLQAAAVVSPDVSRSLEIGRASWRGRVVNWGGAEAMRRKDE